MNIYEKIQARVIDSRTETVTVRMSSKTLIDLEKICDELGVSRNSLIRDFVLISLSQFESDRQRCLE